jgi:hypothetical protein
MCFIWKIVLQKALAINSKYCFENCAEPEFLKILKCNSAESVSAGFPFNCFDIFNDKLLIIGI